MTLNVYQSQEIYAGECDHENRLAGTLIFSTLHIIRLAGSNPFHKKTDTCFLKVFKFYDCSQVIVSRKNRALFKKNYFKNADYVLFRLKSAALKFSSSLEFLTFTWYFLHIGVNIFASNKCCWCIFPWELKTLQICKTYNSKKKKIYMLYRPW